MTNTWDKVIGTKKYNTNLERIKKIAESKNYILNPDTSSSSFGIGDIWLKSRYALITKGSILFTLSGALIVPTADKNANPQIDDRTVDFGLGGILQTKTYKNMIGHLRFGYWLMGKINDSTKLGDMFEYFAKLDYKLTNTLTPFFTIFGTLQGKTKISGRTIDKTEKNRNNIQIGVIYKPSPILWIRPKISAPILPMSKGASIAPYTIGLDFWVIK